ncbi:MAG: immune inhibitor A [Anaerolineae bacterium]|nr:immune inhibitor A [Anaerolineae bacterium]
MTKQPAFTYPVMLTICITLMMVACTFPQQTVQQSSLPSQAPAQIDAMSTPSMTPAPEIVQPTELPSLTPSLTPIPNSVLLANALTQIDIPAHNPIDWFYGMGLLEEQIPGTVSGIPAYRVGSKETFNVGSADSVQATLRYQNAVVAMWVQNGVSINQEDMVRAADTFADQIYPKVRDVFGEEWSPGIDGSPQIHILNLFWLGPYIAGMYVPSDQFPTEIYAYSNQREMFYMSLMASEVGSESYMSTLAHEFQHMVQWHTDRNEAIWVNEGLSQMAQRITGHNDAFTHFNYLFDSRVQLNTWSRDFRESYSHYGASYLYLLYLYERLGEGVIREISHSPMNSLIAIEQVMTGQNIVADDMFAEWLVANYINDVSVEDGRYAYSTETLIPVCPRQRLAAMQGQPPRNTLPQYSGNYIEIEGEGVFDISFKGDTEVRLLPINPKSGRWMWWSNNQDNSDVTLTRAFDLSELDKATLQFWSWYDIEDGSDAGYVLISVDGGQKWEFLKSTSMVYNEEKGEHGPHYTGASGGGKENPQWALEKIDLSHYIGKQVLLRFEYVTDIAYTGHGWLLDDIRIPELNYHDDIEQPDSSWEVNGFARIDNAVPQKWAVYLIEHNGGTSVKRFELAHDNTLDTQVTLPANGQATLVIGAMAPITRVPAQYKLQVGGSGRMASLRYPAGVLFQDDFENPCSSFYAFILPEYAQGYQDGKYEIEINQENTMLWGNAGQELSDVVIEVDTVQVKSTKDSTTGLICRFQDSANYYDLSISNNGSFAIGAFTDGRYIYLLEWTESDAINVGDGAVNHLSAICNGKEISLSVNGVFLGSVKDSKWRRGDIGFSAGTFEEKGMKVSFDNLVVTRP